MALGRSTELRTVASVATTSASTAIAAPAGSFNKGDVGRGITGTGIPASTTVAAVASSTAATLSVAATATGTVTATVGMTATPAIAGASYGFNGWSPETGVESESYTLAAVNAGTVTPDRITNTFTGASSLQRARG